MRPIPMRPIPHPLLSALAVAALLAGTACAARPGPGSPGVPANPFASNYPSAPADPVVRRPRGARAEALRPPGAIPQ